MASTYVDWGNQKVKLIWAASDSLPSQKLITSVHGFCFYNDQLMLVELNDRGWDLPGGHIEPGETAEVCFIREAMEEGYVDGDCMLLGYLEVNHQENLYWAEQSKYPQIGYQVFYRMDITKLLPFEGSYESGRRIFIQPQKFCDYYAGWSNLYETMLCDAMQMASD